MSDKTIVVLADQHCGHKVGLTPPLYQFPTSRSITKRDKWAKLQKVLWEHYKNALKRVKDNFGKIDIAICPGDLIDGKGTKSGGTEQITTDRTEQAEIAALTVAEAECETIRITYGTPYHVGVDEDWENEVVKELEKMGKDVRIGSHEWFEVNGVTFDVKHSVGSSTVPYGLGTPIARTAIWNRLWAVDKMQPLADIIIRGHTHSAYQCGRPNKWYALTAPALQGMGSKFGSRQCEKIIDFGIVVFHIKDNGTWMPYWDTIEVIEQATKAEKL